MPMYRPAWAGHSALGLALIGPEGTRQTEGASPQPSAGRKPSMRDGGRSAGHSTCLQAYCDLGRKFRLSDSRVRCPSGRSPGRWGWDAAAGMATVPRLLDEAKHHRWTTSRMEEREREREREREERERERERERSSTYPSCQPRGKIVAVISQRYCESRTGRCQAVEWAATLYTQDLSRIHSSCLHALP